MLGLMQDTPLTLSSLLDHAARFHGEVEIVSREPGGVTRTNYARAAREILDGVAADHQAPVRAIDIGKNSLGGDHALKTIRHARSPFAAKERLTVLMVNLDQYNQSI